MCTRRTPSSSPWIGTRPQAGRAGRSSPRRGRGCPCARRSCRRSRTGAPARARAAACPGTARGPGRSARRSIFDAGIIRDRAKRSFRKWLGERKRSTPWTACRHAVEPLGRGLDLAFARGPAASTSPGPATGGSPACTRRSTCRTSGRHEALGALAPVARGNVLRIEREVRDAVGALRREWRLRRSRRPPGGAGRRARRGSTSRGACRRPGSRAGARS